MVADISTDPVKVENKTTEGYLSINTLVFSFKLSTYLTDLKY